MQRTYVLEKLSLNKLNGAKTKKQLQAIRKEAESNATLGITAKLRGRLKPELYTDDSQRKNYRYTVRLELAASSDRAEQAFDLVEKTIRKAAQLEKWNVVGEATAVATQAMAVSARPQFIVPQLDETAINTKFNGLFSRDAYLRTIHASVEMFIKSNGERRSHTCLYGCPGSAKTITYQMLKDFYEENSKVERVHIVDGTSLTRAGLENYILDKAESRELTEILVIEEIEKKDPRDVFCLGSIMDGRGVITKLNARVNRSERVKLLVWCTCNSEEILKTFHKGYLWSRFTHKLECVRPSREEMYSILINEISKIGGNPLWAKYALDFGYDVLKTDDAREILGVLDGRERLLTGEYQKDRMEILNIVANYKRKVQIKPDFLE